MMLELISLLLVQAKPQAYYCMPLAIPLVMAAAQFAWGAHQKSQADKRLNALGDAPRDNVSPELQGAYDRALEMSQYGLSPQEKGAFRQNVAQDINSKAQRMKDIGGGSISRVISGIGKIDEIGAENRFAATDAGVHRQNIARADAMARAIQGQKNLGTRDDIREFDTRRAYDDKAGSQGVENMFGGVNLAGLGLSHLTGLTGNNLTPDQLADQQRMASNPYTKMMPRPINTNQPLQASNSNAVGAPDNLNYTDFWSDYVPAQSQYYK